MYTPTLLTLFLSTLTLTHALPADSVLPQDEPPHSTRNCGAVDANIQMARTCAGFSQQSVLFTTTSDIDSNVITMIDEAVKASGGSVGQTFGMKGFK
jgi:hypothetical protein